MIVHVVLFRPKAGLSRENRQALVDAFAAAIHRIPSIRRARVGRRVMHGRAYEQLMAIDYAYAAVLEFDDVAALQAYLENPVHEDLAARFFMCIEQALMYDFALNDGEASLNDLLEEDVR